MTWTGWTEELERELRHLWCDEGWSAGEIAAELGTTRNSVIGKVSRLGIQRINLPPEKRARGRSVDPKLLPLSKRGELAVASVQPPIRLEGPKTRPDVVLALRGAADERPTREEAFRDRPGSVALLDLRECHCRWPFDVPGQATRFCGRPPETSIKTPYCLEHYALSVSAGTYSERRATDLPKEMAA